MSQSGTPSPFASTGERIACCTVTCTFALASVRVPIRVVLVRLPDEAVIVISPNGTTALYRPDASVVVR